MKKLSILIFFVSMISTFLAFGQKENVEEPTEIELEEISVIANRATVRETPVAFSDVSKSDLSDRLASRDLPMILSETPSVYASMSGGGSGDSRVNVRGFNQRNVAELMESLLTIWKMAGFTGPIGME